MTLAADPSEPLDTMLKAIRLNDAEMRVLLSDSAREAERIAATSGSVRAAQLDLAAQQRQMWATVGDQTRVAIGDGVDAAAQSSYYLTDIMLATTGMNARYMYDAVLAQARSGIDSLVSRGMNGIPLSQQVYRTSVASGQQLDRYINAMLLNGSSAREIAKGVRGFIDPFTPGGASYAAMRLGRTELNNAFHRTSVRLNADNPFVEYMKWNLSESHPRPDQCNDYAYGVHMRGGEQGVFRKDEVPGKPHPQCFCYVSAVTLDDDEFVRNFHKGKYDSWINDKLGCRHG
jgi:hypothetical protein